MLILGTELGQKYVSWNRSGTEICSNYTAHVNTWNGSLEQTHRTELERKYVCTDKQDAWNGSLYTNLRLY